MKFPKDRITILIVLFASMLCGQADAQVMSDSLVLQRVMSYVQRITDEPKQINTNVYVRNYFRTDKRNFTLMAIPSMYAISKGSREYVGETYSNILIEDNTIKSANVQVETGTIPHHRNAMPIMLKYLLPNIYGATMIDNQILSPFNRHNMRLYKYKVTNLTDNRAEIVFRPKRYNTQLVSGSAIADRKSGRIIRIKLKGEYDMITFNIDATMGKFGIRSLFPKTCDIESKFHFMGNVLTVSHHSVYDNPVTLSDSIKNSHDIALMNDIRPIPLTEEIETLYEKKRVKDVLEKQRKDSLAMDSISKKKRWDKVLWDVLGDHVINRIRGNFGTEGQGSFRISPILNPLYLSYSKRKGITYKMKIRGNYNFSLNSELSLNINAGYSFKQKQLYFNIPLKYTFNKKRHGYVEIEVGNGNRISNSSIVEQVKNEKTDSIDWNKMNLDYFKDFYLKFNANYDLSEKWSLQPGFIFHKRVAVDTKGFEIAEKPTKYYSFAPTMQIQFRPQGWNGPIFTTDYERGIKGVGKADMEYERFEFDASWRKHYHSLRTLSLRAGCGFYTSKSHDSYFLDYTNFREQNIPRGWNDDWTGEFQLLNSNWYNASEYYVRANATYESPLMLLSRIPYIGRLMEMERIYANALIVEHLCPYIEYGYGFTNRFFSMGLFVATSNRNFEGFGCRFGFELFRDW